MAHECPDCGTVFDTLSELRLHDCPDSGAEDGGGSSVERGELDDLAERAGEGDVAALYRALAAYEQTLSAALDAADGGDAYRDVFRDYYEPLADALDRAARAEGWPILEDAIDAYDPDEDDDVPLISPVIENAVGRFVIRTRLADGVERVPADALAYLRRIPLNTEESVAWEESFTYGWGIGHPEHPVADHLHAMATEHRFWVSGTLEQAFYADQTDAVDLLARIVTDDDVAFTLSHPQGEVGAARFFLDCVVGPHGGRQPPVPRYWECDEAFGGFEWEPAVKARIRELVEETRVADDLPDDWELQDLGL